MGGDGKGGGGEGGANLGGEHGLVVRRHPDGAVERRGAVAVKPHERVHPIGIEGEKAPARAQQAKDFPGARRRVGKVVHEDRKSTRLNSSHQIISYAVFCLKKKKTTQSSKSRSRAIDNTAATTLKTPRS